MTAKYAVHIGVMRLIGTDQLQLKYMPGYTLSGMVRATDAGCRVKYVDNIRSGPIDELISVLKLMYELGVVRVDHNTSKASQRPSISDHHDRTLAARIVTYLVSLGYDARVHQSGPSNIALWHSALVYI